MEELIWTWVRFSKVRELKSIIVCSLYCIKCIWSEWLLSLCEIPCFHSPCKIYLENSWTLDIFGFLYRYCYYPFWENASIEEGKFLISLNFFELDHGSVAKRLSWNTLFILLARIWWNASWSSGSLASTTRYVFRIHINNSSYRCHATFKRSVSICNYSDLQLFQKLVSCKRFNLFKYWWFWIRPFAVYACFSDKLFTKINLQLYSNDFYWQAVRFWFGNLLTKAASICRFERPKTQSHMSPVALHGT